MAEIKRMSRREFAKRKKTTIVKKKITLGFYEIALSVKKREIIKESKTSDEKPSIFPTIIFALFILFILISIGYGVYVDLNKEEIDFL